MKLNGVTFTKDDIQGIKTKKFWTLGLLLRCQLLKRKAQLHMECNTELLVPGSNLNNLVLRVYQVCLGFALLDSDWSGKH